MSNSTDYLGYNRTLSKAELFIQEQGLPDYFRDAVSPELIRSGEINTNITFRGTTSLQNVTILNDLKLEQVTAPSAPSVALGTVGVLTGNYRYQITFVTSTGRETEAGSSSSQISPSSQKVEITNIPIYRGNISVTKRKIYRTEAGGLSFYLVNTIENNTETTYSDNIADGSLGVKVPNENSTAGTITLGDDILGFFGIKNIFLGRYSGESRTTGVFNTGIGKGVFQLLTEGSYNVAVGNSCLDANTTGNYNVGLGTSVLGSNTIGGANVAIGQSALAASVTTSFNVAVGAFALSAVNNILGSKNVAMGYGVGDLITSGAGNILFGYQTGDNITTGDYNIVIGYDINADSATADNQLNIGGTIKGDLSTGIGGFVGGLELTEKSADPANPAEGKSVIWQSDGIGAGDDGDIMIKITAGSVTKTVTLIDYSAF